MNEQIDIAEDLGVVSPQFPAILTEEEFLRTVPPAPPQIIQGLLHQGCKMILGGTSKSNKSWCLLDLALSVATGQKWWGHQCEKAAVVYINFELQPWAAGERLAALRAARPECGSSEGRLHVWNLRGHNADLTLLRPKLEEQLTRYKLGLIIVDPAYKVLGDRDENANGEIASLMNEFEAMAQRTGGAIVVAHHFAKGDSTAKNAMDRMSGAGAWARDPDSILILTPHEEQDCFTVSTILRNLPQVPEFVLSWEFPLMNRANDLNPEALRRPQGRAKVCTDKDFIDAVITENPKSFKAIVSEAWDQLNMSKRSVSNYLKRLVQAELVRCSSGVYWRAK